MISDVSGPAQTEEKKTIVNNELGNIQSVPAREAPTKPGPAHHTGNHPSSLSPHIFDRLFIYWHNPSLALPVPLALRVFFPIPPFALLLKWSFS